MTDEQQLAITTEAGRHIDPEIAEVLWVYAHTIDPYGMLSDVPDEYSQVGREYFARSPGSDIWILFADLPRDTSDALRAKHKSEVAFPAWLGLGAEL